MPFKSEAQRRFLNKNHPAIARRWAKNYGNKANVVAKQRAMQSAKQRTKPVQPKGELPPVKQSPAKQPVPLPKPQPRRSPPIYQNPNQPNQGGQRKPVPLPRPVPNTGNADKRQQMMDMINRYRNKTQYRGTQKSLDNVQKMQQRGMMIKNVGGPDYKGPIKSVPEKKY